MKKKRILIYRIGSIGDTIISLPIINRIKETFEEYEITILTNIDKKNKNCSIIDILWKSHFFKKKIIYKKNISSLINLYRLLKKEEYEILIYLMPNRSIIQSIRDFLFFKISNIKIIKGMKINSYYRYNSLDNVGNLEKEINRLKRNHAYLNNIKDKYLQFSDFNYHEKNKIKKLIKLKKNKKYAVINAGTSNEKMWSKKKWEKVISYLKRIDYDVILVGIKEEKLSYTNNTIKFNNVDNQLGKLDVREMYLLIIKSNLFIGIDSGPYHMAATSNVSTICLFGNLIKPKKWLHENKNTINIINNRGVKKINSSVVINKINRLIN